MSVISPDGYKRWKLETGVDKTAQLFTGKSTEYEDWKDLTIDTAASTWYGWRPILEHVLTLKEPHLVGNNKVNTYAYGTYKTSAGRIALDPLGPHRAMHG